MRLMTCALSIVLAGCASSAPDPAIVAQAFEGAFRVTHSGEEPRLLFRVDPVIPHRLQLIETAVAVDLFVNERGKVAGSQFIAGDEAFYPLVARAVRKWRFEPLRQEGTPASFVLPVGFALRWQTKPLAGHLDVRLVRESGDAAP